MYFPGGYGLYGSSDSLYTYLILIVPAFILSIIAQIAVKSAYSKMSRMPNSRGLTGAQAAYRILSYYNITNVHIEQCAGNLTDHYDPRTNVIRLSEGVYNSTSVAAVGIACHEAGHAAQHALGYAPIRIRNTILPVCKIGSYAGIPLALVGYWLGFGVLVYVGLLLYSFIMLFQLATLPVEFNASMRAIKVIDETGMLTDGEELNGAKKVLRCAALTYVASLAVSLANLLRFIILLTGRKRK